LDKFGSNGNGKVEVGLEDLKTFNEKVEVFRAIKEKENYSSQEKEFILKNGTENTALYKNGSVGDYKKLKEQHLKEFEVQLMQDNPSKEFKKDFVSFYDGGSSLPINVNQIQFAPDLVDKMIESPGVYKIYFNYTLNSNSVANCEPLVKFKSKTANNKALFKLALNGNTKSSDNTRKDYGVTITENSTNSDDAYASYLGGTEYKFIKSSNEDKGLVELEYVKPTENNDDTSKPFNVAWKEGKLIDISFKKNDKHLWFTPSIPKVLSLKVQTTEDQTPVIKYKINQSGNDIGLGNDWLAWSLLDSTKVIANNLEKIKDEFIQNDDWKYALNIGQSLGNALFLFETVGYVPSYYKNSKLFITNDSSENVTLFDGENHSSNAQNQGNIVFDGTIVGLNREDESIDSLQKLFEYAIENQSKELVCLVNNENEFSLVWNEKKLKENATQRPVQISQ